MGHESGPSPEEMGIPGVDKIASAAQPERSGNRQENSSDIRLDKNKVAGEIADYMSTALRNAEGDLTVLERKIRDSDQLGTEDIYQFVLTNREIERFLGEFTAYTDIINHEIIPIPADLVYKRKGEDLEQKGRDLMERSWNLTQLFLGKLTKK